MDSRGNLEFSKSDDLVPFLGCWVSIQIESFNSNAPVTGPLAEQFIFR